LITPYRGNWAKAKTGSGKTARAFGSGPIARNRKLNASIQSLVLSYGLAEQVGKKFVVGARIQILKVLTPAAECRMGPQIARVTHGRSICSTPWANMIIYPCRLDLSE